MAFLVRSPEISTVFARIFADPNPNSKPNPNPKSLRRVAVSAADTRNWLGSKASVGVEDQKAGLFGQSSALVKESYKRSSEEEEKQNYYANLGDAIRTLREEFPDLFYRELSFDIYRDDIVFRDPMNTFMGVENYKSIFWSLRFHGRIFFRALRVDIISIWQPAENTLMIRWTAHGIPRVPWESHGRFDGTSEYKFDKNGKIYEHKVDNIALNSPPKFHMLTVQELFEAVTCPSTPKPTYFEISSSTLETSYTATRSSFPCK
ncbi:PREDICTED: uncharacterized protein LOC104802051 [Tarenaya hassleriana]|uniref:uncharacterized protein LOC104802051 n=1 Tax=Tarenaya hassleriana TaxID=28532 RepID=UPI00053C357B|nr:PREDICTED: uncharacterized protein LOC104802051 [Tarenaya hassleriana]